MNNTANNKNDTKSLKKINRLLTLTNKINNLIIRIQPHNKLFEEVCEITTTYGNFRMCWISLIKEEAKTVYPVCWNGFEDGYLTVIKNATENNPFENEPSAQAIIEEKTVVCNDIAADLSIGAWRHEALQRGYFSSIAVPIKVRGKTIGVFNLYSNKVNFFSTQEEVQLYENITENIAFSLEATLKEEERNQAEQKLKGSEHELKLLLNNTAQGIYGVDLDGNFTFANAASLRMLGYEREEDLLGKHAHTLVHHTRADGSPYPTEECCIYKALYDSNGAHVLDEVFWHSSGISFPVEYWSFSIIKEGTIIGTVATFYDITERNRAEEAILQSNERYNLVAKATNDAIWDWNITTGEIIRTPEGFKTLFGYDLENINSNYLNWTKLIHPEDFIRIKESLDIVFNNPDDFYWEQDFRFLKADGQYAFVNDKGLIIRDKDGKAVRLIGAMQDITEHVKHINAIEDQNKKLREIAWIQSHIVRAPLSRMMGIVDELKATELNSAEFKEWVNHFVNSSTELDSIIHDISSKTEAMDLS
ncbi:PAS domain S-box protein [Flavobacterium sp. ZS1P14]|uniref:PAS domain S-box protein n=1 Tax=Flavobacterium sp. ZS1P14 TaxID=3401729 RepID=UPI003AAEB5B2